MNEPFYDRLFAGDVRWALHTTYTCDLHYVASLLQAQQGKPRGQRRLLHDRLSPSATGVFYHSSQSVQVRTSGSGRSLSWKEVASVLHPLQGDKQTFHAKISLVCSETGHFRLAVYSKNLEFNSTCNETALLFTLEAEPEETKSGAQLISYLKKLRESTDAAGQAWLDQNIFQNAAVLHDLGRIRLISEFDQKPAQLFFGGCGGSVSLGARVQLFSATARSIVLTPPEFLRGTHSWDTFAAWNQEGGGPRLYDLVPKEDREASSSHIKLYLLEKVTKDKDTVYELWTGSANATLHGLGWLAKDSYDNSDEHASVECLVKISLTKEEFEGLRSDIQIGYHAFSFAPEDRGSLDVTPDRFGPWMCANFQVKQLEYKDQAGNVCREKLKQTARQVTVVLEAKGPLHPLSAPSEEQIWRPAEYREPQRVDASFPTSGGILTLEYSIQSFRASQGALLFGRSCTILWVPDHLLQGIPTAKGSVTRDTRLSDWLLSQAALDAVEPAEDLAAPEDNLARWYYAQLTHGQCPAPLEPASNQTAPAVGQAAPLSGTLPICSEDDPESQENPLPFQRNGADRIVEILGSQSRAFLADEAGLGKTYSTAAAVCRMAQEQWQKQETPTPFLCIYVAPNKALLNKCALDFQSKAATLLQKGVETIEALQPERKRKAALAQALENWYGQKGLELAATCKSLKPASRLSAELIGDELLADTLKAMGRTCEEISVVQEELHRSQTVRADSALKGAVKKIGIGDWKWKWFKSDYVQQASKIQNKRTQDDLERGLEQEKREAFSRLDTWDEDALSGFGCRRFVNGLRGKYAPKSWADLQEDYSLASVEPDRLVNYGRLLDAQQPTGRTIVLMPVSVGCLLDPVKSEAERATLRNSGQTTRGEYTRTFLDKRCPQVVIWDEFHRYTTKLKETNEVYSQIVQHERSGKGTMKSIFLSATPYNTNISGKENEAALDRLYQNLCKDEKEELTQLPSFENDFAPLFCDGLPRMDPRALCRLHLAFSKTPGDPQIRAGLEKALRFRMIRHERTQLQGELEHHLRLYPPQSLCTDPCGTLLCHTRDQCRALEEAGFTEGDRRWSLSLPWILSFYKSNSDPDHSQRLDPVGKDFSDDPALFAYAPGAVPIVDRLLTLPEQNLPFYEMCRENLQEAMCQLLWVPPTVPLYDPGPDSIFHRCRDYSKLLVFAEYHYYQKGGALLLSDYAKARNAVSQPMPELPELHCTELVKRYQFSLTQQDWRGCTLDQLVQNVQARYNLDETSALALIASPAACASALEMDSQCVEDAFNAYFRRDGVREALWKWLWENETEGNWVRGILRYCAEGNLYAVLEEWQFITKGNDPKQLIKQLIELLDPSQSFAKVTVNARKDLYAPDRKAERERRRSCSFADRLTGDVDDVGSGDNSEAISACAARFSSPFWPMVLFAGRGAQEGMDFHQYCLRILHLTIPRGAVSFDQRNGRIDRFRSLLVRRRAAERLEGLSCGTCEKLLKRMFSYLRQTAQNISPDDPLCPDWHIPVANSRHHFEQLFPVWPYTEEHAALQICDAMLESYRRPFGSSAQATQQVIDLRAPGPKFQ